MRHMLITLALLPLLALPFLVSAATACPSLSLGSTGASVTAIQKILYAAYANFPSPTGKFDATTEAAVQQWQKERSIVSSGTPATTGYGAVGPKTAAAMKLCVAAPAASLAPAPVKTTTSVVPNSTATVRSISRGMSGSDVTVLQQFLVSQKLLSSDSATGFFGALTEAAVQKFQSQKGIASSGTPATTGYGAVGPKTRATIAVLSGGAKVATVAGGVGGTGGGTIVPVVVPTSNPTPTPTPNPNPVPVDTQLCTFGTAVIGSCVLQ